MMLEGLLAPGQAPGVELPTITARDMAKARSWSKDLAFCG